MNGHNRLSIKNYRNVFVFTKANGRTIEFDRNLVKLKWRSLNWLYKIQKRNESKIFKHGKLLLIDIRYVWIGSIDCVPHIYNLSYAIMCVWIMCIGYEFKWLEKQGICSSAQKSPGEFKKALARSPWRISSSSSFTPTSFSSAWISKCNKSYFLLSVIRYVISHRFHSVCVQQHSQPRDGAIQLNMILQDPLRAHAQAIPMYAVRETVHWLLKCNNLAIIHSLTNFYFCQRFCKCAM